MKAVAMPAISSITFQAVQLRHGSPDGTGCDRVVERRASSSQASAVTGASRLQSASEASHESSACATGMLAPAASAAPRLMLSAYAPLATTARRANRAL